MPDMLAVLQRSFAFFSKEIIEVLRQPKLVVTLVLAPFVILALFGAGYRQDAGPLRTTFVSADPTVFADTVEPRLDELGDKIDYRGLTSDRVEAVAELKAGVIDAVVVLPDDPEASIRSSNRAVFEVLHDRLDPYEQATIRLITNAAVDAVNRSLLEELVAAGQEQTPTSSITEAARAASALRVAIERGQAAVARTEQQRLAEQLDLLATSDATTVVGDISLFESAPPEQVRTAVLAIDPDSTGEDQLATIRAIETDLEEIEARVTEFQSIEPEVLVSPFGADSNLVGSIDLRLTDFYAPGVIALLLQHLAVTFAALSLVRERALGTTEVFRIAPLRAAQMLAGKYAGYLAISLIVGGALSLLVFFGLGVPFVGAVEDYVIVLVLLIMASLGVGFVVSSLVTNDTQAVNASMFLLLLSIFFSGFFLSIDRLVPAVRAVSWTLPITHALDVLRDVLFRGSGIEPGRLLVLAGGSVALFFVASHLTHRRLAGAR